MSIRTRTALSVALTMLMLTAVFVFLGARRIDSGFGRLNQRDASKGVGLVTGWLRNQSAAAGSNAQSYGDWTPSYRLNLHPTKAAVRRYATTRLPPGTLESLAADFMIFEDLQKRVVYSKFVRHGDARDEILAAVAGDPRLTRFTAKERTAIHRATIATTIGPVSIGIAPTLHEDPSIPASGVLITGRFLDTATVRPALAEQTGLLAADTVWYSPRQPGIPPTMKAATQELRADGAESLVKRRADGRLEGYGLVNGLHGAPAATVRVAVDPEIGQVRFSLLRDAVVGLLVFTIVSIAALVITLDTAFLTRLTGLISGVRAISTADEKQEARVRVEGRDELAELATSVNGMLEAIDRQQDDLQRLATVDPLTHVSNRGSFVEELRKELARCLRLGRGGGLFWLDLDHFKQINDSYGHATGDKVLVAVAEMLTTTMPAAASVARIGGDEFVTLVPGADREQVRLVAERVLERLNDHRLKVEGRTIKIGMSIGVAFYPEHGDTVQALLEAADNAMYDAKRKGRGRVTVLPAPAPPEAGGPAPT